MRYKRKSICLFLLLIITTGLFAQNSSLTNKKLVKVDDISSVVESGIGSLLGGRVHGTLDSGVVTRETERELHVKLFYRGYEQGILKVQATDGQRQKQKGLQSEDISLTGKSGQIACVLQLDPLLPKGHVLESPFLRIEITKESGRPGQVFNYVLNKRWKVDLDPENVVIGVKPVPVGSAAMLKESEVKDVLPQKSIFFKVDKLYNNPKSEEKVKPARESFQRVDRPTNFNGGSKSIRHSFSPDALQSFADNSDASFLSDDISGTWINTDAGTNSITKLIINGNRQIQVFGKCSPTDCDWGNVTMEDKGNNTFKAVYNMSFKVSTLFLSYTNSTLTLVANDVFSDSRGSRTYTHTFRKNAPAILLLATPVFTIKDYAAANPSAANSRPATPVDLAPKGPDNHPIYLWGDLKADIDIERPQDISNINMNIFPDKNKQSGVYYFIPADYHLRYKTKPEAEKGFDLSIQYGTRSSETSAPVRMSASLTAGMTMREVAFIKTLLKANIPTVKELKILPLREKPVFSFQSNLTSQYNIPQDKVMVESSTDLGNDIRVAWQTDPETKEFIQSALLAREGLAASVVLKPQEESIIDQQIPVTINLADNRTFGKITLDPASWRTQNWRNTTPYPLQLKHLNILKLSSEAKAPVIYSWSLGDALVQPKAQVAFDASAVPTWLDNQESVLMWIDYAITDCRTCDQKVIDAVTGGVSGNRSQMVKFIVPPAVFDTLGASYFLVSVRSLQMDPNGETVKESVAALKITKDETKEYTVGPFYVPTDGTLSFEYKLRMATTDGEFKESAEWYPTVEKEVLLGKTRMKQIFPTQSSGQ